MHLVEGYRSAEAHNQIEDVMATLKPVPLCDNHLLGHRLYLLATCVVPRVLSYLV